MEGILSTKFVVSVMTTLLGKFHQLVRLFAFVYYNRQCLLDI